MALSRVILHLDLDAFFCAVEEIKDPSLRGKAFAVGGSPSGRGVVTSCSYPARKSGVRSAMPAAKALQLCPDLILVSRNHGDYSHYSRLVMERLRSFTDQIEQISIDEAFLDISGLDISPKQFGGQLQKTILGELDLPNSIGIASNKLVAKIATDVGKMAAGGDGPPNAITIVPSGEERQFLAPLPVEMLWGVGPWFLVSISIAVIAFVMWLWRASPPGRWLSHLGFGLIIGFFINLDTTEFFNASQMLASFLAIEDNGSAHASPETFSHSTGETIEALFEHACIEMGKLPATMSTTIIFIHLFILILILL